MAAIIRVGTTQVLVNEGDKIRIDRMEAEAGAPVEIQDVLAVIHGADVVYGRPLVDGAKVEAKVIGHGKDSKIKVFKYSPKKRYRLTRGHRQDYTEIQIEKIITPGAGQPAATEPVEA